MTKSTITREQLEEWVAQFDEDGGCDATDMQLEALIRQSLAAMDSESGCLPLDYLQGHKDGLEWAAQLAEANHPETGDWLYDDPIELAKAIRKGPDMPPAQPVAYSEPVPVVPDGYVMVPKEPTERMVIDGFESEPDETFSEPEVWEAFQKMSGCEQAAYRARLCWAAMLAAAPQSPGSEPATVPGKWIPVSERMPIEFEAVIAFDGDQVYGEAMYSSDDGFTIDGYEPCDRLNLQNVTHWMPLPAAPQEVKGE